MVMITIKIIRITKQQQQQYNNDNNSCDNGNKSIKSGPDNYSSKTDNDTVNI